MYKISVIVPIYNAEKYLKRCLDSLVQQTLNEIEIICINDGSTDTTAAILSDYAQRFSHIKIITHQKNAGESAARNTGLRHTSGEYLGFVDSDDTVDPDFFAKLYTKATTEQADIAKANSVSIDYTGKTVYCNLNQLIKENNSKFYFTYHWWTAIYRNKIIKENNICFNDDVSLGEDLLFLNQAVLKANKLALIDDTYYHYYRRPDSSDSKILSLNKIKCVLSVLTEILQNTLNPNIIAVDTKGVNYICSWCIEHALDIPFKTDSSEGLDECLKTALTLYQKSKQFLKKEDIKILPVIKKFLDDEDCAGLKNFYIKNNSLQKIAIANLRYLTTDGNKNAIRK